MKNSSQIKKAFDQRINTPVDREFPAFMGNREGLVKADKKNNVYVLDYSGNVRKVKNNRVPNVFKLPVIVGYAKDNPTLLQVLRMRDAYVNPPYPNVPEHAEIMHTRYGYDPVFIQHSQILEGYATPAATTGMVVQLRGFQYYLNGSHVLDNTTVDFTADLPVNGANWVVAEVDNVGVITKRAGSTVASRELLTPEDIPLVVSDKKVLFAVKCYLGQTRIVQTSKTSDIFDMRFMDIATGGLATAIAWGDVIGKPATWDELWAELTGVTAGVVAEGATAFPRYWYKNAPPDPLVDDVTAGYNKSDIWIDQAAATAYVNIDNTDGAAIWLQVSSNGGGASCFAIDGVLAVVDGATSSIVIADDQTIPSWTMYLKTLGASGSTVLDVILKRVGGADVSIFNNVVTDNRPQIAFNDVDNLITATPLITDFLAGDVLVPNIDQVAPGAASVVLAPLSSGGGGGGGSGLTVTDGITPVTNVGQIGLRNQLLVNLGGGQVEIGTDYILLRDEKPSGTKSGTFTSGAWQTRDITAEVIDTGNHCSLPGSNYIRLAAGTYEYHISAPAYAASQNQARLYDVTAGAMVTNGEGSSEMAGVAGHPVQTRSLISGRFTIAAQNDFRIEHYCTLTATDNGFGVNGNNGEKEIYTIAEFWRVG